MPTEVLYRKWRPQRFADVSGQSVLTRTLVNAVATHKVSHAYLFSGPRGTGKTTTARILAKAINCALNATDAPASPGEPCDACASCVAFGTGSALDLIEMDGASNRGIDDIRELRDATNYLPMGGALAHKVYLIDEVHMLTEQAFNALLKTLEEPPPHVIFILATTDAHKVPATILSRCQRHEFRRIPLPAMADRLAVIASNEDIALPREGLELIARNATGSLRDAINLLEQICDSYGSEASLEAVREGLGLIGDERSTRLALQALRGDLAGGLTTIGAVRDDGLDLKQFKKEVVLRLRELLFVQAGADAGATWTPEQIAEMNASLDGVAPARLVQALRAFGQADLREDPLSPLPLELALAESMFGATPAAVDANAPAARPQAPPRPAPQQRPSAPQPPRAPAAVPSRSARAVATPASPPETRTPAGVPAAPRKDLTNASAEDIARMLGSKAPVIPAASDTPEQPPVAPAANGSRDAASAANGNSAALPTAGGGPSDGIDLAAFGDQFYAAMKPVNSGLAAVINGSCHAISWADGVLTLGFTSEFHKGKFSEAKNKPAFEQVAAQMIGAPVAIRCIIAPKPARALNKSPLVQHAVEAHGAKIVSEHEES